MDDNQWNAKKGHDFWCSVFFALMLGLFEMDEVLVLWVWNMCQVLQVSISLLPLFFCSL